jgi:hypothetical protein
VKVERVEERMPACSGMRGHGRRRGEGVNYIR